MSNQLEELLAAVGMALMEWSAVEQSLVGLFAVLSDIQDGRDIQMNRKAHAIFDTIVSFETRLDIVNTLVAEEGLSALDQETWMRCSARTMKLYKKRHGLAHFSLVNKAKDTQGINLMLSPFFTMGGLLRGETKVLSLEDVRARGHSFLEVPPVIAWFLAKARMRRGLPIDNPKPEPPLLLRLRALAAQILEERARKRPTPQGK